jgi:hypothetical protein
MLFYRTATERGLVPFMSLLNSLAWIRLAGRLALPATVGRARLLPSQFFGRGLET